MTELKVKCSSCGHIEKVAKVNSFTIASNENEQFNKWLEEHDKQIRAEVIDKVLPLIKDIRGLCRDDVLKDLIEKVEQLKEQK